ncbi:MAG: homoserine O-succinyltransferase [Acidocella sp.]|nr:homoserine O-succinyltransferase [Acidocella sp.]
MPVNPTPHIAPDLTIGLVNIMAPSAMRATLAQFSAVLGLGLPGRNITLKLFTFRPVHRHKPDHSLALADYADLDDLWSTPLDALIVTGTEPQSTSMSTEPFWPAITQLVDWAGENTISTVWSCFSAHAAAYRLDGVPRVPFGKKRSGLFACHKVSDHSVLAHAPAQWVVPHSRHNTLAEDDLVQAGYQILARGPRIGADSFTKRHHNSDFIFFQGHPEYGPDTLLGEYRRDIKRYLMGQQPHYPALPEAYFPADTIAAYNTLKTLSARKTMTTALDALNQIPATPPAASWHQPACDIYTGWLGYLHAQKSFGCRIHNEIMAAE